MSYFEDASLVLIPSAQKTSKVYSVKPTDGTGDLTFTRTGDTATRVGPDGLIEKVRTNLVVQSNTFNVTWDNIGSSETSGQAGYDGTNNAWSLIEDSSTGNHLTRSFPSVTGLSTISIYAKAGTRDFLYLRGVQSSANVIGWFNLSTGAVGTVQTNGTGKIESVGNGWYRCSLTVANFQAGFEIYVGLSNADNVTSYTGNGTGNILIQSAQVETGDIATDYIATTTAAVSVGPVANVPRLDYLNSSCPRLLLEPQRVNLVSYSEAFNDASWAKTRCTVTANAGNSPDGYANADKLVEDSTNNSKFFAKSATTADSSSYTLSLFAKAAERNEVALVSRDKAGAFKTTVFGLTSGTIVSDQHTGTKIEDYGNGWYRCSVVFNTGTGGTATTMYVQTALNGNLSYQGDGTSGILIYGAGWELGSYVTSYIPTLGAAVTRGADACSKTGISSLIGQTEGTLFVEEYHDASVANNSGFDDTLVAATDGTSSNIIAIFHYGLGGGASNKVLFFIRLSNSTQAAIFSDSLPTGTYKIAAAYKNNDVVLYINGVQIGTDTSAAIPATSVVTLVDPLTTNAATKTVRESQLMLFKTRLTNAQLAELTTI